MRTQPPVALIDLLQRLGLARAGQVRRVGRYVRRLPRDLPRFESVWVDALARGRVLTPFQAAEINAGRGESLRVGPFVLEVRLSWPDYARAYRARRVGSDETVRLLVVEDRNGQAAENFHRWESLVAAQTESDHLAPISEVGRDESIIWAASRWVEGCSAAQWMVHNGRFPPEAVLEIARAMAFGLTDLERMGVTHEDIGASGLVLTDDADVVLLQPGVRGILRAEEGHAHTDLPPQAYDYLAPERITEGRPPNVLSDVYACGCLWWHLLCGRPPLPGGDTLAKLRAASEAKIPDVRRLAPETPERLAAAVSACLERRPGQRPESMARLAAMLGSPTQCGRAALLNSLRHPQRPLARRSGTLRPRRRTGRGGRRRTWRWAGVAACLVLAAVAFQPGWPMDGPTPSNDMPTGNNRAVAQRAPSRPPVSPLDVTSSQQNQAREPIVSATRPPDMVLAAGEPHRLESLELVPGQTVRGIPGMRPRIIVSDAGLLVDSENVCFRDIDFVHEPDDPGADAALIDLRVARAEFHRCRFEGSGSAATALAAIRWTHPGEQDDIALSLPSGRIRLSDCVLQGVGVGIDCRTAGALGVVLANCLHVDSGPLVQLDHCPGPDEPVSFALSQVTLRGSGPLLHCDYDQVQQRPGEILVRAAGCAFVPRQDVPLIRFTGATSPERILRSLRWTGQGSLVLPETLIAAWDMPDGRRTPLDDASVSMVGLVRSKVGFAGSQEMGPAASRLTRWQAPLRSANAPGIDATTLPPDIRPPTHARAAPGEGRLADVWH